MAQRYLDLAMIDFVEASHDVQGRDLVEALGPTMTRAFIKSISRLRVYDTLWRSRILSVFGQAEYKRSPRFLRGLDRAYTFSKLTFLAASCLR